jgi:hypothetical protein
MNLSAVVEEIEAEVDRMPVRNDLEHVHGSDSVISFVYTSRA